MNYEFNEYSDRIKINGVIYDPEDHVVHWEDVEVGADVITIYVDFRREFAIRMTSRAGRCVKLEKYYTDCCDSEFDLRDPYPNDIELLPHPESMDMDADFDVDEGRPEPADE
jgi:hypothetical protein